ncbi:unnamed protein product, partial [Prorocentrum cordatum]
MSTTGVLKSMFAEKGFGFVTPDDGSDDCFVHVKDNPELDGIDSGGDAVTFDKEWDDRKGKYKGVNCRALRAPFDGAPAAEGTTQKCPPWSAKDTQASLASVQSSCMQMATDHDASVAGRAGELKTIAEAKKLLQETSSGAVEETYSFLQRKSGSALKTSADLKNAEVVRFVRRLAK